MRFRFIASLLLSLTVTGCAGWNKGAPSCDGSAKRPLNKSLWDWEAKPPAPPVPELPPVKRLGQAEPSGASGRFTQAEVTWSTFDIARSFQQCGGAARHG